MNALLLPDGKRRMLVFAPLLVMVLFAVLLGVSLDLRRRSTAQVQGTYQGILLLHGLRGRLVDAETGQRGFLVTADSAYLAPYRDADADVRRLLGGLETSLAHDSAQARRVAAVRSNVTERLAILQLPIARRAESFEAARDQLIAGRGRESMERLRALLAELENAELAELESQLARQRLGTLGIAALLVLGALVVLLVTAYTRRQFQGYEHELETANAELAESNARLQEQTIELELQAQELEVQAGELEARAAELESANEELQRQHRELEELAVELETANDDLQVANQLADDRRREAERANQVKTQFLTSMSHELRTPLNAVAGYVDLLQLGVHGPLTDPQRSCLERIRHNGEHLLVLINDILDYAKLQAGKVELRSKRVALGELIADTEALVRPLLQARRISFQAAPGGDDVPVRGDPDRIRQILLNLLSNAAKYTDPGGSVVVSTEAVDHIVRVRVQDSGNGIPEDMQAAIFDPFVQLQRGAGGSLADGVGLGLSISRELAAAMQGELTVESAPGQGSTFTLTLQRAEPTPA